MELAPDKTEAVILSGKRKRQDIFFELDAVRIIPDKAIRYLGVMVGENISFGAHVEKVTKRASERAAALTRLMPNTRGPSFGKRKLLCSVVDSIMFYAIPIWHDVLRINKYRKMLEQVQRKVLLRLARAYRTVSTTALQVITGTPPIDLVAEERILIYKANEHPISNATRREIDEIILEKWQRRWNENAEIGQWTKRLIPVLRTWVNCGHRRLDYHLTQLLTGHGTFRQYTRRIGKTDDNCIYCPAIDTAEHALIDCPRWENKRLETRLALGLGILTPNNILEEMVKSKEKWLVGEKFIQYIMKTKETDELNLND